MRGRVPQLDRDRNGFIHNGLHYSTARFRIDSSTPLSEIAYLNRLAIIQALDQKEIEIGMAVTREMVRRRQRIHICEPFERSFSVTNWSAAWKGLDFSTAIKGDENGKSERTALKMVVLGDSKELGMPGRCKWTLFISPSREINTSLCS